MKYDTGGLKAGGFMRRAGITNVSMKYDTTGGLKAGGYYQCLYEVRHPPEASRRAGITNVSMKYDTTGGLKAGGYYQCLYEVRHHRRPQGGRVLLKAGGTPEASRRAGITNVSMKYDTLKAGGGLKAGGYYQCLYEVRHHRRPQGGRVLPMSL